jgi:hypothetical protein
MKMLHVFDGPIIFEENGGVLQLRRLTQSMTPSPTAFDVDKPKLSSAKRQIGTGPA